MQQYTDDSIVRKDLRILQTASGYRFSVDAIFLAHFIQCEPEENILEIGSGSGVVAVVLSALRKFGTVTAVEIQSELANLCRMNFERNGIFNGRVFEGDINELAHTLPAQSFDLIYSNPPYRKTGSGKLNPLKEKAIARHELKLKLEDLLHCSKLLLKPEGRLITILPAYREKDFLRLTEKFEMHIVQKQSVHSFENELPAFFLTTAAFIGGQRRPHSGESRPIQSECHEFPKVVIYRKPGEYSEQMNKLLNL